MVLAAGRGERMRPLTDRCPKPLLPVAGRALIQHHLRALAVAGVQHVVVNVAWQGQQICAALQADPVPGISLEFLHEPAGALETGGGIFNALPHLGSAAFIVVNADIWTDFAFRDLVCADDALAHLVMVPNPAHNQDGDFALEDGAVSAGGAHCWTFSGIGVYRPQLFEGCEPGRFPLVPLLRRAMAAGRVSGQLYRGKWMDIGTPARLEAARRLAALGSGTRPMDQ